MKKIFFLALAAGLLMSSCGGKTTKKESSNDETKPCSTKLEQLIGTVGPGTAMHSLQLCQMGLKTDTVWIAIGDSTDVKNANLVIGNLVEVLCKPCADGELVALSIEGNQTYAEAIGDWTTPDPGNSKQQMGVQLDIEGVASSINMHTLVYKSWQLTQNPGEVILIGESIGSGQTFEFADTARIYKKDGQLMMGFKGNDLPYTKQAN